MYGFSTNVKVQIFLEGLKIQRFVIPGGGVQVSSFAPFLLLGPFFTRFVLAIFNLDIV